MVLTEEQGQLKLYPHEGEGEGEVKAIRVRGRGAPLGCETSRLPHFLDNRLQDGDNVVSLTRRPSSTPQEDS
jgi:hypothetical protein